MRLPILLALVLVAGCSRDLTIPALPGSGVVTGQVVYAVPGRSEKRPAVGAVVSLVGSGLQTTTNAGGAFSLDLDAREGLLLFRYDANADGTVDQQLVLQLSEYGTGPHKRVDLGEILLGQNAAVHGKVLRADLGALRSGHGGSAIFVPEGPFSAYTADDGSYLLPNLPAGPLTFMVFRAGYAAVSLGSVKLRPGEDFGFSDVTLVPSLEPQLPGTLRGALAFAPPAAGRGDSAVSAQAPGQLAITGSVAEDLTFAFTAVPPGLYVITATRTGYTPARASNVLVLPSAETSVAPITLTDTAPLDAGQPPVPDAGPAPDAGSLDAGLPDAGCGGAGCRLCSFNADCTSSEWCDLGVCAPQCTTSAQCTNGRACDGVTRTCVRTCDGGCPTGLTCDPAANLCRVACDSSFPCAVGFKCGPANRCVPECALPAECGQAWQTCQAGQCVPNTLCIIDLQCASNRFCLTGSCVARPTAATDAGVFSCTQACDCRQGEWCQAGGCVADPIVPTFFFRADGGGDGTSSVSPAAELFDWLSDAGANQAFALRAGDTFTAAEPFPIDASGVALAGGYVDCAPGRWVRDPLARTTLWVDGGTVVKVNQPASPPLKDVKVFGLQLSAASTCGYLGQLDVDRVRRLQVQNVRGAFVASACQVHQPAVLRCDGCDEVSLREVALGPSADPVATFLHVVRMTGGYGLIQGTSLEPQPAALSSMEMVSLVSPTGPVQVLDSVLGPVLARQVRGISATNCGAHLLDLERNVLAWPTAPPGAISYFGIYTADCPKVTVAGNLIDGSGTLGAAHPSGVGIYLGGATGTVENNTIKLPTATSSAELLGIVANPIAGQLELRDNRVVGGAATSLYGLFLSNATGGPVKLTRNTVELGDALYSYALRLYGGGANWFWVEDNLFSARGLGGCSGSLAYGAHFDSTQVRAERNRFFADRGGALFGARVLGVSQLELYSNHFWTGSATCSGQPSSALDLYGAAQVYLRGNTLDPRGTTQQPGSTRGLTCTNASGLLAEGNIIGGGRSEDHRAVQDDSAVPTCLNPANWRSNYFWYEHLLTQPDGGEGALAIVSADAGQKDSNGNLFNFGISCFADAGPSSDGGDARPYLLGAASPCVDTGRLLLRQDTTPIEVDLDGTSRRDAGAGPDIGCSERH